MNTIRAAFLLAAGLILGFALHGCSSPTRADVGRSRFTTQRVVSEQWVQLYLVTDTQTGHEYLADVDGALVQVK